MLDLGWSELLIIAVAALIVVGPKDLPRMLRTLGQYAAKAKGVAREFQRSMDDAARQADIDELRQVKKDLDTDVTGLRDAQYKMQREMSQSFLDSPKNKNAKDKNAKDSKAKDKATDKAEDEAISAAGDAAPAARQAPAGEAPADTPAPAAPEPAAPEPAAPDPPPRKARGA